MTSGLLVTERTGPTVTLTLSHQEIPKGRLELVRMPSLLWSYF